MVSFLTWHVQCIFLTYLYITGNLKQLKDARGWAFHQSLADTYHHVVRYHGLGNVSDSSTATGTRNELNGLRLFGSAAGATMGLGSEGFAIHCVERAGCIRRKREVYSVSLGSTLLLSIDH